MNIKCYVRREQTDSWKLKSGEMAKQRVLICNELTTEPCSMLDAFFVVVPRESKLPELVGKKVLVGADRADTFSGRLRLFAVDIVELNTNTK